VKRASVASVRLAAVHRVHCQFLQSVPHRVTSGCSGMKELNLFSAHASRVPSAVKRTDHVLIEPDRSHANNTPVRNVLQKMSLHHTILCIDKMIDILDCGGPR